MTHLKIELNTGITEQVSSAVILKLYDVVTNNTLDNTSHLLGNLNTDATYQTYIDVLTDRTNSLTEDLYITATKKYITFEDPEVERRVIAWFFNNKQDTNGVSTDELTVPTNSLVGRRGVISGEGNNRMFEGITNVYKFNELSRFTNVTELPPNWASNASFTEIDLSNILTFGNACICYNNISYADLSAVTNIGTGTFEGCSNLTTVVLNPNLTTIGYKVFYDCNKLENIDLSNIVTIGYGAFYNTKLTSVNLSSCTTINGAADKGAFMLCSSLTSVTLGSNLTALGRECFNTCTALTSIDLSNITSLEYKTFNGCTSLSSVGQLNPNLTTIPNGCFRSCSSLTSIDLSNVTSVGGDYLVGAFAGCTSLTNIGSLANVRHFGRECFKNCPIGTGQDLEITTTDTKWAGEQFYGTKYKSVVLHGALLDKIWTSGVSHAFSNMVNMEFIDLSDTAITSASAYGYATKTELIVHPSTVTTVSWDALSYTNSNTTVKYIVILAETPPTLSETRYTYLQKGNIYVKDSVTVDAYKAAWPQYTYGSSNWDLHAHIKPLSELPVGVWKTGLYQLYEPYLSNSSDPAYATT